MRVVVFLHSKMGFMEAPRKGRRGFWASPKSKKRRHGDPWSAVRTAVTVQGVTRE